MQNNDTSVFQKRFAELLQENVQNEADLEIIELELPLDTTDSTIERFEKLEIVCLPVPADMLTEVRRQLRIRKWARREN